jgi:hypothetical protein
MTVKTLVDFYFTQYEKLNIKVEMWSGMKGKYTTYTKESFYNCFGDWLNESEKVMTISFQTHYHNYATLETEECPIPMLYICYK